MTTKLKRRRQYSIRAERAYRDWVKRYVMQCQNKPRTSPEWTLLDLAEGQGFEPWEALTSLVFKTSAFDHSATPPEGRSPRC